VRRFPIALRGAQTYTCAHGRVLHQDCVGPERQAPSVFPSVLHALAAENHGNQVFINDRVSVEYGQAGACCRSLARFHTTEAWHFKQLIRVVPRLVVLHEGDATVVEGYVALIVGRPRVKVIVRHFLTAAQRHEVY